MNAPMRIINKPWFRPVIRSAIHPTRIPTTSHAMMLTANSVTCSLNSVTCSLCNAAVQAWFLALAGGFLQSFTVLTVAPKSGTRPEALAFSNKPRS
jgi:hypothetical protein